MIDAGTARALGRGGVRAWGLGPDGLGLAALTGRAIARAPSQRKVS